jgi:hypothetical protein
MRVCSPERDNGGLQPQNVLREDLVNDETASAESLVLSARVHNCQTF